MPEGLLLSPLRLYTRNDAGMYRQILIKFGIEVVTNIYWLNVIYVDF
jgi:hypothetical protein